MNEVSGMQQLPEYYSDVTQSVPIVQLKKHRKVHWTFIWNVFIGFIQIALLCTILLGILWAIWNVQIAR